MGWIILTHVLMFAGQHTVTFRVARRAHPLNGIVHAYRSSGVHVGQKTHFKTHKKNALNYYWPPQDWVVDLTLLARMISSHSSLCAFIYAIVCVSTVACRM
jgi:hypothetical protein